MAAVIRDHLTAALHILRRLEASVEGGAVNADLAQAGAEVALAHGMAVALLDVATGAEVDGPESYPAALAEIRRMI